MVDPYMKGVLTVIAIALVALVYQNGIQQVQAQSSSSCGSRSDPCYLATWSPLEVSIKK